LVYEFSEWIVYGVKELKNWGKVVNQFRNKIEMNEI